MSAKKIQRQHRRMQCFGVIMLVVLCFGSILAVVGISNSIEKIHENIIAKTPDAILASAGVTEGQNVKLAVSYYDQKADPCVNLYDKANAEALNDRQFEWSEFVNDMKQLLQEQNCLILVTLWLLCISVTKAVSRSH